MTFRARIVRAATVVLWGIALILGGYWAVRSIDERGQTARTTERFDPPVWAGQNFLPGCAGGFYARKDSTIVLVFSAHCGNPGDTPSDPKGPMGVVGPRAQLQDCPEGRFCAPSDIMTLAVAPDRIPWGHLNMVDMGAGGYRTIEPGTRALACADVKVGDPFEMNGREHYRAGRIVAIQPYDDGADTLFPCILLGDRPVFTGDSGAAVFVRGVPAGIVARRLGDRSGITPLAEGLENLGLVLCTTPDCDLTPERAEQP
jgi:hypothetical protein